MYLGKVDDFTEGYTFLGDPNQSVLNLLVEGAQMQDTFQDPKFTLLKVKRKSLSKYPNLMIRSSVNAKYSEVNQK